MLINQISHVLIPNKDGLVGTQLGNMIFAASVASLEMKKACVGVPLSKKCDTGALSHNGSLQRSQTQRAKFRLPA